MSLNLSKKLAPKFSASLLVSSFFNETSIIFFFELTSNPIICFFEFFTLIKSDINEYSKLEIYFLNEEILNFSSTNRTRFDEFFFDIFFL